MVRVTLVLGKLGSGAGRRSNGKCRMKMVEALIRAGKPYDLIVLPEEGHGFTGASRTYVQEAIRRYFQEDLEP